MSILESELLMYLSAVQDDTTASGGKLTANQVITNQNNNVWPNVFKAERENGSRKYRKTFMKVANDDDLTLYFAMLWLDIVTPGDDWVTFWEGSKTDTNPATLVSGADHYGCGTLVSNVSASGTTLIVDVEDAELAPGGAYPIFRNGDKIRITDKLTPSAVSGNEGIHTIDAVPTVGSVTQVTLSITPALATDFTTAANTRVMSVLEPASIDVVASIGTVTKSTTSGTFDEVTTGNVVADNIGSIDETYTLTFTDATNFTCRDVATNVIGSGTTGSDFSPLNADFSKPLFTILSASWGGTWAAAETVTIPTVSATVPIWQMRRVPAAAGSLAGDKTTVVMTGESI